MNEEIITHDRKSLMKLIKSKSLAVIKSAFLRVK